MIDFKGMIQKINKRVNYNEALKSSDGKFYLFESYIYTKCEDLIEEAIIKMRIYLEAKNVKYLYSDLLDVITKFLIEPTFNGFRSEQLNIGLLEGMGFEIFTFPNEELKHKFDVNYSIDHVVTKGGKYYGIQSKCGSFLNTPISDRDKYYFKHLEGMKKHLGIADVYYIFHNVGDPNEVLSWDKKGYIPNGIRFGDILISTHNVMAFNNFGKPLIRFSDFRYLSTEEALKVWIEEERKRNNPFK